MGMEYGTIAGVDTPVSRLIQGCVMISTEDPDGAMALLDGVYECGCTAFDTALVYGGGGSETMLGRWVAARGLRRKVVIVDKGAHHSGERQRVTPEDINADVATCLERLGTDYVDLFLLHRDDPDVPVGPIVDVLNEHREAGRVRAFGGSNWTAKRVAEANEYADSKGLTGFAASSPNHSLAIPQDEPWDNCVSISGAAGAADRAWYEQTQLPVLFWSSLAGGFFSGRFSRQDADGSGDYFDDLVVKCYCTDENYDRLEWAAKVAGEQGLTVPQVALAWVLAQPMNVYPLVGCRAPSEFAANVEALGVELPADAPGA